MNLYEVTFDASTYIVVAKSKYYLYHLLHKHDSNFQQKADGSIFYKWGSQTEPEDCHIHEIDQNLQHIVFTVSH